jgi:hypothetical protein
MAIDCKLIEVANSGLEKSSTDVEFASMITNKFLAANGISG